MRFTPNALTDHNLGVLLCPGHAHLTPPEVTTYRDAQTEVAEFGDCQVFVNQNRGIDSRGIRSAAVCVLSVQGSEYEVGESGINPPR